MFVYKTKGVCSTTISIDIEDGILKSVEFTNGCSGNLQGISHLVKGMKIDDVITRLQGIDCRNRGTSCPDQLTKALIQWKEEHK